MFMWIGYVVFLIRKKCDYVGSFKFVLFFDLFDFSMILIIRGEDERKELNGFVYL